MIPRAMATGALRKPMHFDFVCIDEVQDMTEQFYLLVMDYFAKVRSLSAPQMLIVGDPFQQVYKYRGARLEYLLRPHLYFSFATSSAAAAAAVESSEERDGGEDANADDDCSPTPWVELKLSVSFRISHEMAKFINSKLDPRKLKHAYPEWYEKHGKWIDAAWQSGIHAAETRAPEPGSVVELSGYATAEMIQAVDKCFVEFTQSQTVMLALTTKA
jgi:hypothetical protein